MEAARMKTGKDTDKDKEVNHLILSQNYRIIIISKVQTTYIFNQSICLLMINVCMKDFLM